MTAVELCARCAGDPRDGIGYHAFDCAEVAPKERVMTASERLEEPTVRLNLRYKHGAYRVDVPGDCDGEYVDAASFDALAAATSPLLARIEALEKAGHAMCLEIELMARKPHAQLDEARLQFLATLSSPSSIKEEGVQE